MFIFTCDLFFLSGYFKGCLALSLCNFTILCIDMNFFLFVLFEMHHAAQSCGYMDFLDYECQCLLKSISSSCCCSVTKSCPTLCNPKDCRTPGFLVLHHLSGLLRPMSIESLMPSNHLTLCCPLLLLPSIFPASGSFSMSQLHIRGPKPLLSLNYLDLKLDTGYTFSFYAMSFNLSLMISISSLMEYY